jgi:hypothetical protein
VGISFIDCRQVPCGCTCAQLELCLGGNPSIYDLEVTLALLEDRTCDCDPYNDTHILTPQSTAFPNTWIWSKSLGSCSGFGGDLVATLVCVNPDTEITKPDSCDISFAANIGGNIGPLLIAIDFSNGMGMSYNIDSAYNGMTNKEFWLHLCNEEVMTFVDGRTHPASTIVPCDPSEAEPGGGGYCAPFQSGGARMIDITADVLLLK